MIQFLETIRLADGILQQLDLHQQRVDRTLKAHYGTRINLSCIKIPHACNKGVYKCRVVYDTEIREIDFQPYILRPRMIVKVVNGDDIDYPYKYADRTPINTLWHGAQADDVIILKNGLLTDSAYANIILQNDDGLFTPTRPLLCGTMRQRLLDEQAILTKDIDATQLSDYQYIHFVNAMQPLGCQPPMAVKDLVL